MPHTKPVKCRAGINFSTWGDVLVPHHILNRKSFSNYLKKFFERDVLGFFEREYLCAFQLNPNRIIIAA